MSGIAGIFDLDGKREPDRAALGRMRNALSHRGAARGDLHIEPGLAFATRSGRRDAADAPLARSAGGRSMVAVDGRLANSPALEGQLALQGRLPERSSDATILSEIVDLRGADALPELSGPFAFAAWNPREGTLLLARDRFGERPLYWHVTRDGLLLFASEPRALLASGLVHTLPSEDAVADYLFYGFVPEPHTIYRGIACLPAGHTLLLRRRRPVPAPRRWWTPPAPPGPGDAAEEARAEIAPLLQAAVEAHRRGERACGAMPAETLPDRAVAAALGQHPDPDTPPARTAEHDPEALAEKAMGLFGEPFADLSLLRRLDDFEALGRRAGTVLWGAGGAEVLGGHARYALFEEDARLRAPLPAAVRARGFGALAAACPGPAIAPGLAEARSRLTRLAREEAEAYAAALAVVPPGQWRSLLAAPLRSSDPARHVRARLEPVRAQPAFARVRAVDLMLLVPGRMGFGADRLSASAGLDLASPFLDPAFSDWALRLPRVPGEKPASGYSALEHAFAGELPAAPPAAPVILPRKALAGAVRGRGAWRDSGYLDIDAVEKLAARHERGRIDAAPALWSVLMLDAFLAGFSS
ncbi:asparagine synthetase B family protein [Parvularcula oceani]|uniref:asparagine synthetase B family protein n=1 Tax=Parvularcula oceani TaxID=1247963 RepID=UPI0004E17A55|nr:asparagine synthetase B [Parvularcula oceani]